MASTLLTNIIVNQRRLEIKCITNILRLESAGQNITKEVYGTHKTRPY
jgi:hypothetical protein